MSKPKLTYFDAPMSRGEECRLALHLAKIDFHDERIKGAEWPAHKPKTPFGSLPVLEWPGRAPLAQTNAILVLLGRLHDLHPKEEFEAARHEEMMAHVEDLRHILGPTLRIKDEAEKKAVREQLAATSLPAWAEAAERHILGDGPFFAGPKLHVVDLKILLGVRWLRSGALDHVSKTILDGYPKLNRVHDAVQAHEGVKAWYAKQ